jgi:hypothetical protein
MRRLTGSILILALVVMAAGCGSMQISIKEPQAAKITAKSKGWRAEPMTLPVQINIRTRSKAMYRISDIPLKPGVEIFARIKTYGGTDFTKAGQVPVVINEQDIQDVMRGNVVRIVVVDPKKEYQTSQFESLRLSPTDDAVQRANEIGDLLVLVTLGNRDPYAK